MKALEDKIVRKGAVLPGDVLKVGSFLNQQLDVPFISQMGCEIARLFEGEQIDRVLTIEASGIAIAFAAATAIGVPVVVAKKARANNQSGAMLSVEIASYTHNNTYFATVGAEYLPKGSRVLIVDDFLARGNALRGLCEMLRTAGCRVVGAAIAIEKAYQGGGDALRAEGLRIESLAKVASMSVEEGIAFA